MGMVAMWSENGQAFFFVWGESRNGEILAARGEQIIYEMKWYSSALFDLIDEKDMKEPSPEGDTAGWLPIGFYVWEGRLYGDEYEREIEGKVRPATRADFTEFNIILPD